MTEKRVAERRSPKYKRKKKDASVESQRLTVRRAVQMDENEREVEKLVGEDEERKVAGLIGAPVPVSAWLTYDKDSEREHPCHTATVLYKQSRLAANTHTYFMSQYRIALESTEQLCPHSERSIEAVTRLGNDMEVVKTAVRASCGRDGIVLTATNGDKDGNSIVRMTSNGSVVAECDTSLFSTKPHRSVIGCAQLGGASVRRGEQFAVGIYCAQLPAPETRTFGHTGTEFKGWKRNREAPRDRGWAEQLEDTEGGTGLFMLRAPLAYSRDGDAGADVVLGSSKPVPVPCPDGISPSQPQLVNPNCGKGEIFAVFTGWEKAASNFPNLVYDEQPASETRLGAIYCMNRPCSLYAVINAEGCDMREEESMAKLVAVNVTPQLSSAHSPRLSPDGEKMVFLSHENAIEHGVHGSSAALMMLDLEEMRIHCMNADANNSNENISPKLLIPSSSFRQRHTYKDAIEDIPRHPDPFVISSGHKTDLYSQWCFGIYATTLPESPWVDNQIILVNTVIRSQNHVIAYSIDAEEPVSFLFAKNKVDPDDVPDDTKFHSIECLACTHGCVLAVYSTPFHAPKVCAYCVDSDMALPNISRVSYLELEPSRPMAATLNGETTILVDNQWKNSMHQMVGPRFEAIVLRGHPEKGCIGDVPSDARRQRPLILLPHGGPHSASSTSFGFVPNALTSLGCDVALVNYRGSLGFGDTALLSLPVRSPRESWHQNDTQFAAND